MASVDWPYSHWTVMLHSSIIVVWAVGCSTTTLILYPNDQELIQSNPTNSSCCGNGRCGWSVWLQAATAVIKPPFLTLTDLDRSFYSLTEDCIKYKISYSLDFWVRVVRERVVSGSERMRRHALTLGVILVHQLDLYSVFFRWDFNFWRTRIRSS